SSGRTSASTRAGSASGRRRSRPRGPFFSSPFLGRPLHRASLVPLPRKRGRKCAAAFLPLRSGCEAGEGHSPKGGGGGRKIKTLHVDCGAMLDVGVCREKKPSGARHAGPVRKTSRSLRR